MRILLCTEITCGSTHKTVNLHVELVSDVFTGRVVIFVIEEGPDEEEGRTRRRASMVHPSAMLLSSAVFKVQTILIQQFGFLAEKQRQMVT
jgi:hypothetical protein